MRGIAGWILLALGLFAPAAVRAIPPDATYVG